MSHLDTPTWAKRAAYIFISALVTVALALVISLVSRAWFNNPPIRVRSLDRPFVEPLCPGQVHNARNQIMVDEPTILFSYFSVMDKGENYNINGTQLANGARPHPHAAAFTQTLSWVVPDLPPGQYSRVLAFRGADTRENLLFVSTPFEIGANCP